MKYQIFFTLIIISQSSIALGQKKATNEVVFAKIDSLFDAHYSPNETGAAFAIIQNGATSYKRSTGLANVEHGVAISDSTVFNIASVSKQFTTYLALLLEEEGKISFQDDIRMYLPELSHLKEKISIKDLTNHTHGLPNSYELAYVKGVLPDGGMSHQQILQMLLNIQQPNFKVGDKYEYNNTGYMLLSEIIERVGKMPFKQQLIERIFLPLGMNHTQAVDEEELLVKNKAYSYRMINGAYQYFPNRFTAIGSSGIHSTIDDMILWAKNFQNPKVGNSSFYKRMSEATLLNSGEEVEYGLGLQFTNYKGLDVVFHAGGTVGYRSYILHVPKHHLSITILANSNDFSGLDMVYGAVDILLEEFIKKEEHKSKKVSSSQLKRFAGTYEFQPSVFFTLMAENDSLFFQSFGTNQRLHLPFLFNTTFEFPDLPHTKLTFHENSFDFRIADFTYECFKTIIQQPDSSEITLSDFVGTFRNKEHKITFDLVLVDQKLRLIRAIGTDIPLSPLSLTSFFYSDFGKLDFTYNSKGKVTGFNLSGQNFKNLVFEK